MQLNKKAWNILTEDEKTALGLQLVQEKSSWKAGEIMNKSHYKYLEIKYRAEQFLKLFTEHFELFDEVVPKYITGNKTVIKYFDICLSKRVKPMVAIGEIAQETKERLTKSMLNEKILRQMEDWEKSDDPYSAAIYNLVREFDRWNNFRILPRDIQEPSAYKRRVKNFHKKQVRVATSISTLSLDKLRKLFCIKKGGYYLGIMYGDLPQVWMVKKTEMSLKVFNTLGLYLWESQKQAEDYIEIISDYTTKTTKACTDGLDFWPKYREMIKQAKNYEEVQRITPTRRHLQMAMAKFEFL